jgi:phage terminase large subunit-like protein
MSSFNSRVGFGVVVMTISRGSTFDNAANLAPTFLTAIASRYEGTRLGRQELYAELLEDIPGALWRRDWIDETRVGGCNRMHPHCGRHRSGRQHHRGQR